MKLFVRILAVSLLSLAVACSGGNNDANNDGNGDTNNSVNNSGGDAGNNGVTEQDVDNTGVEYAAEYETIFDSIAFDDKPANQLNILISNNLDTTLEFPIIVLLEFADIDADAGTMTLRGGSGVKTDEPGVFEWDTSESDGMPPEGTPGTLEATTGEFEASIDSFGFVATFKFEDKVSKTILPINDLAIEGQLVLEDDGGTARVTNGYIEGYLTKEDGDETDITLNPGGEPVSITQIFKESTLNYDTATSTKVEAGTGDAWFIAGTYTSIATDIDD